MCIFCLFCEQINGYGYGTGDRDVLDVDTSRAAYVLVASASLDVLRRRSTLSLTLGESVTLLRPRQLAEEGANVAAAERVDDGCLSDGAVAEQFEFDARQRPMVDRRRQVFHSAVQASAARSRHSASAAELLDVRVTSVRRHRLQFITTQRKRLRRRSSSQTRLIARGVE